MEQLENENTNKYIYTSQYNLNRKMSANEKLLRNILITQQKSCQYLEMISIMMSLQMSTDNPYLSNSIKEETELEKIRLIKRLHKLGSSMSVHNKHKRYKNSNSELRQHGKSVPLRDKD
tara:strand:+ start:14318 stop:14674 length:357 start_codon:yes stop_codon:yes gene_type:complete